MYFLKVQIQGKKLYKILFEACKVLSENIDEAIKYSKKILVKKMDKTSFVNSLQAFLGDFLTNNLVHKLTAASVYQSFVQTCFFSKSLSELN